MDDCNLSQRKKKKNFRRKKKSTSHFFPKSKTDVKHLIHLRHQVPVAWQVTTEAKRRPSLHLRMSGDVNNQSQTLTLEHTWLAASKFSEVWIWRLTWSLFSFALMPLMIIGSELLHPEWDYDSFRLPPQAVSTDGDPQWGVQVPTTDICCRHCGVLRWAASCFYSGMSRMRAIIINGWHLRVLPSLAFSLLLSLSIFPGFFFLPLFFVTTRVQGTFPVGLLQRGIPAHKCRCGEAF